MNLTEVRKEFDRNIEKYNSLGQNVAESLRILLQSANLKTLSIYYRIKDLDSFLEKIERKSYQKPFEETEDICGIRIICYYQKDISKIEEILTKEFETIDSFKKENDLDYNEFGYRSHHLIASIKKEWESTPNFRGLSKLKFELQIRTVLMHAWAEIEHNLSYKNKAQTPRHFRRKLGVISAVLEDADQKFDELKKESEKYQKQLLKDAKNNRLVNENKTELNMDSLQVFMDFNFPKRSKHNGATGRLLNKMVENNISLIDLKNAWDKIKPHFKEMERDFFGNSTQRWLQAGIAEFILELTSERHLGLHSGITQMKTEQLMKKYFA